MYIFVERDEHGRLVMLVEDRIRDLRPQIRRCQQFRSKDELKEELACLTRVLHRLHEAECDVSA